jgi:basic membrane protein A and related proteins
VTRRAPWLLLLAAALVLAGCSGGGDDSTAPVDTVEVEEPSPPVKPLQIALVTDASGRNDGGVNALAAEGLEAAIEQFGVAGRVVEPKAEADYFADLKSLAGEDLDLIISVGPGLARATHRAADEFPDASFATIDATFGGASCAATDSCELPNLLGVVFREEEAGYLAGYLAGLETKTGTVSGIAMKGDPASERYLAGFERGALHANSSSVLVLRATAPNKKSCRALALEQVETGADIVFEAASACEARALEAATDEGVRAIAADVDRRDLGAHIVATAAKNVHVAVFKTIDAVRGGSFEGGGTVVLGLKEEGVGLSSVQASRKVLEALELRRRSIVRGEIEIPTELSD